MTWLTEFSDVLNNPNMRHAAIVHLPVALAAIGLVFAIINAILRGRNNTLHWTTFFLYVGLVLGGWLAKASGEDAEESLPGNLSAAANDLIHEHEELGEWVWIAAAITAAVLRIAAAEKPLMKLIGSIGGALAAVVTMGLVANTAHFGGSAVYLHGAGTQSTAATASAPTPAADGFADPRAEFFVTQVHPILEANCMRCHNAERARGGLDQTSIAGLLKGGKDPQWHPVLVPGNPDASWLIIAVRQTDPDLAMPPKERLTDEQIAILEQWIRDGAVWDAPSAKNEKD